jgi:UDP-glucuronate decarboxylase
MRFMATPSGHTGPINIGNPHEHTVVELAKRIIELTGSHASIVFLPLPADDPKQRQPDIRLARELLNWNARGRHRRWTAKDHRVFPRQVATGR